ncbi:PrgI family protein, partial [bacterium]|nr:PrgI family protein [bacterium]
FVGPLSFKQFIFIGIGAIAGYLSFLALKGFWPALVFTLPIIIVCGFLGFPWGRDQPTEIWLAARIRFFIKPRVRIWNQSGLNELVTVTAPKKIDKTYTNGLTQNEVQSRLSGLATLVDSRGWAIKNASQNNAYTSPLTTSSDDRLLDVATFMPQEVSDTAHATDILDESNNSTAMHFEKMIQASEQKHRQEIMQTMQTALHKPASEQTAPQQQGADFWFLNGADAAPANQTAPNQQPKDATQQAPAYATFNQAATVLPALPGFSQQQSAMPILQENLAAQVTKADEEALLQKVHDSQQHHNQPYGNLRTIAPLGQQTAHDLNTATAPPPQAQQQPQNTVTPPVDPAIIKLASNDDLNIDTIARQAHQQTDNNNGEVVISLH